MTTDRSALESARDALPPLPEPAYWLSTDSKRGRRIAWNPVAFFQQKPAGKFMGVFTGDQVREAVTAALSSPPVLPAEQVVGYVMKSGHGTHFLESITDAHRALSWAGRPMWRPVVYAAPQEAAPALDDARDAKGGSDV